MRNYQRFDKVVWTLVFGGLLLLGPGVAMQRAGESWGWLVIVSGAVAAAVGFILVWVRSRMPDPSDP